MKLVFIILNKIPVLWGIPKVMFMLRTINPIPHLQLWEEFDDITREALCQVLSSNAAIKYCVHGHQGGGNDELPGADGPS